MAAEEKRRDLLNDINKAQERYNQLQDIAARRGQDYSKALEAQEKKIKSLATELKKVNSVIQDKLDFYADEERGIKSISSSFSNFTKLQKQSLDISRSITYQMSEPQREAITNTLSLSRDLADLTVEDTAQIEKRVSELNTQLNLVEQLFGAESEVLAALKKQAEEAKSLSSLSKEEKEIIDLQKQAADKLKQTFQGISETVQTVVMRLFSVKGIMGGALYAAGEFVDKMSQANKELGQVGRGLGNGVGSASLLSFFFKDSVGALKELGSEFGGVENASLKTQLQTNLIANNMGIGVGEAAKLQGSFARLNDNSTDVAADLIKSTQQFAYQNKIIPSQLMGDLANSAEEFALFGKQGGENIIRAAGYAAKLGVNMKTLSGVSKGLLDFESSITKELELGAMLGRNINLNRARALAYEGDIEGATKETLKALGGVDAFNRMDVFQRQQTADLLGVSVAELEKMAKYQEQANTLGGQLNMAFDSVTESVSALGNTFGGKLLKGAGSFLMTASQAGAQFSAMGVDVKGLASKLPGIGKFFGAATPSIAETVTETASDSLKEKATEAIKDKVTESGETLADKAKDSISDKITGKIEDAESPAGKGGIMDSMSKINMSAVLKGAAAMVLVAGAVYILGKALQEYKEVGLNEILAAAGGMLILGAAIAGLGYLIGNPVVGAGILLGAAAMLVIAGAIWVLGKAIQEMATGFSMLSGLSDQLIGLISIIPGMIALAGAFSLLGASLGVMAIGGIAALPVMLGLGAVGAGLGFLFNAFGDEEETGAIEEGSLSEYNTQMLSKMDELIQVTKAAKDVYLDREKVTGLVVSTSEKNSVNKFSLNNA